MRTGKLKGLRAMADSRREKRIVDNIRRQLRESRRNEAMEYELIETYGDWEVVEVARDGDPSYHVRHARLPIDLRIKGYDGSLAAGRLALELHEKVYSDGFGESRKKRFELRTQKRDAKEGATTRGGYDLNSMGGGFGGPNEVFLGTSHGEHNVPRVSVGLYSGGRRDGLSYVSDVFEEGFRADLTPSTPEDEEKARLHQERVDEFKARLAEVIVRELEELDASVEKAMDELMAEIFNGRRV